MNIESSYNNKNNYKLLFIGLFLQLLYVLFSIIFFKERILYADSSRYLVEMLGDHNFHIINRLIVFFSSILPVIGINLGCSVKAAMVLYSINIALVYSVSFLLILQILKNKELAIGLLLYQFSFPYLTHYLAISELQFGIIFLMTYWSLLVHYIKSNRPVLKQFIIYPLLFILMNSHPLIILAFIGSTIITSTKKNYWNLKDQKLLIPLAIVFYFISRAIFTSDYESHLISRVSINSLADVNVYLIRVMISQIVRQYFPFFVLMLIGIFLIFKHFQVWKIILIVGLFVLQFLLIYLRFYDHFIIDTFYEIYLSLIAFLLILSFVLHVDKFTNKLQNIIWTFVILLSIIQFGRTLKHAQFYTERIEIYEDLFSQMKSNNISKAVLPFYKAPMEKIIDTYDTPFETYLLSQIDTDKNNNGYIISYWLKDSIDISYFKNYSQSFFRYDKDSISIFPFENYPKLETLEQPYGTFNAVYKE